MGSVALSTTEAEFCVLSECAKSIIWIRYLLGDLDCEQISPTEVREDNQKAIVWSNEGIRHAKHVAIRHNFVREQVTEGIIRVTYCPTGEMTEDIPTKPLSRTMFQQHRISLEVSDFEGTQA